MTTPEELTSDIDRLGRTALKVKAQRDELLNVAITGYELVSTAYAHVSHGGPTREDAEAWLAAAKQAILSAGGKV